ncbi:MAG: M23 family metallopeptidase [Rhodocyclaceae bacterium]|jgi:murein DD-endopeptidase MepM/ murein hydrolase activator NlpD|nr:M23 family metallopeptidase [Rhodocyclaceae bacterium]
MNTPASHPFCAVAVRQRLTFPKRAAFLLAALLALPATAQRAGPREGTIDASGLAVAFDENHACPPIASPFASPTRYDNSRRPIDRFGGRHGGIDLSLKEGTPLLAVADGEAIAGGEGGLMEGIYLWLRHAPQDSGLPFWTFTKYQHLSAPPDLKPGTRVKAGQPVGLSGATGTAGKHYGTAGYPHLHLTTFYGPSGEYEIKGLSGSMVSARGAQLDDPLILYLKDIRELSEVRALPEARRTVRPGIVLDSGEIIPPNGRTVWPVACRHK